METLLEVIITQQTGHVFYHQFYLCISYVKLA